MDYAASVQDGRRHVFERDVAPTVHTLSYTQPSGSYPAGSRTPPLSITVRPPALEQPRRPFLATHAECNRQREGHTRQ